MNRYSEKARMESDSKILKGFNYTLLIISVLIIYMPLLAVLSTSFKSDKEFLNSDVFNLPENFLYLENFKYMFTKGGILTGYYNSFILCLVSVLISVILGSMVAFVVCRFKNTFTRIVLNAYIMSIMIPFVTTQVAIFGIIKALGMYNTIYAGILLYAGTDIMSIYIFIQFINKIPVELDESGMMDGAGYFRIFWSIILPMLKPAMATVAILKILNVYNDMFIPQLYMPSSKLKTVSTAIMGFASERTASWPIVAAGIMVALIPTVIIFLFLQKYIVSGVAAGAVKG